MCISPFESYYIEQPRNEVGFPKCFTLYLEARWVWKFWISTVVGAVTKKSSMVIDTIMVPVATCLKYMHGSVVDCL